MTEEQYDMTDLLPFEDVVTACQFLPTHITDVRIESWLKQDRGLFPKPIRIPTPRSPRMLKVSEVRHWAHDKFATVAPNDYRNFVNLLDQMVARTAKARAKAAEVVSE